MKIFDYAKEHPEEILAVTDDGEEILYGELNNLSIELGKTTGHRLVFVFCRNTPGSFLGYLGLLESGGVPLLLDADIAPELLHELVRTYRPAFCLVPDNLDEQTLQACFGFSEDRHVPAENETAIRIWQPWWISMDGSQIETFSDLKPLQVGNRRIFALSYSETNGTYAIINTSNALYQVKERDYLKDRISSIILLFIVII